MQRNRFVRCGTVLYVNAQGVGFDKNADFCNTVSPPLETQCNTGAAEWMTTQSPAREEWSRRWPELLHIRDDHLGLPAHSRLANNTYCSCPILTSVTAANLTAWEVQVAGNVEDRDCERV